MFGERAGERWQAASDVCDELKWIVEGGSQAGIPAPVATHRKHRERLLAGVAAVAVATALALALLHFGRTREETRVLKVSVLPPEKAAFNVRSIPAVSPDGRRLAFVATVDGKNELWVRDFGFAGRSPIAWNRRGRPSFLVTREQSDCIFRGGKTEED